LPYTWSGKTINAAGTYRDTLTSSRGCDSIINLILNVNSILRDTTRTTICTNQLPYNWNGNTINAAGTYRDTLTSSRGCDSIINLILTVNSILRDTTRTTICTNQLPYNWNGNTINVAGTYRDTLTSSRGCDSIINLILTVNSILRDTTRTTICTNQLPYTWSGKTITTAGTYRDTLTSSRGCDSIINLILTVNSILRDTTRTTICTNQLPYTWNGNNINSAGTYRDTLTSSRGCDSIINLILTVNSVLRDTTRTTICTNQLPYNWNGNNINSAGTYRDTLTSSRGCDSISTLILTVNSILRDTTRTTICTNQLPYTWSGKTITAAGTYRDTLTSSRGCDSIINLILTVNSVLRDTTRTTICTNQLPYNWNGNTINTAGTYRDTLTSSRGCDSIINLILTVNSVLRDTTRTTICTNQLPYTWNGNTINAAGTYRDTLTSSRGCDSIINLILTVNSILRDTTRTTICTNQLPYTWSGKTITAAGTYRDTLTSSRGCDSIINLILTVNSVLRDTTRTTICTNQLPYNWNGNTINTAGTYRDTLTSSRGCDSIINLILTVNSILRDTTRTTICTNQLPYTWSGKTFTAAGTYRDTLTNSRGCDSIINLILTVNSILRDTTRTTICTNQLPYNWNGNIINTAGTYRDTLTSSRGCDSIINLILTVNSVLRDTTRTTICTNQLPYNWNGNTINTAGTYRDTLTSSRGCDSIINLILTVNSVLRDTTRTTICTNQLPYTWNGNTINAAGTYRDTLTSSRGCDSIINLILTVNSVLRDTTRTTICTNQLPYTWSGKTINAAGTYRDTLTSSRGCDSIINLILTVNSILRDTTRTTICTNQLPYTWNGNTINTAGTYRDTLTSSRGCDSIINLILTVNSILRDTTRTTICTNQLPYNWNGNTINAAGTYRDTLTSSRGCDSIINLILTVNSILRDTTRTTICTNQLPYTWSGKTITAAGTYRDTLTSSRGCDSIINLILTVNSILRDTTRTTICTNQLPYNWNGNIINTAGTYRDTLTSSRGCDSIINLILTVNSILRDTTRTTICTNQLPYTWSGKTITAAGTYRDTLTSSRGCDSIINLILTVNSILRDTTRTTICTNQLPYTWNGNTINAAGTYRDTLTSSGGCDSIINLILTVNSVLRDTTRTTICTNQLPYTWNGNTINAAGTYRDTLTSRGGCDSISTLILTVNSILRDTTRTTICTNQLPYNWNGNIINTAGTFRDTLTSSRGCDSIINLILTVNSVLRDTTRTTICTNQLPYTWNGKTITAAGTYRDTLTSSRGCDSIVNLILTVNSILRDTTRTTICTNQLPYTWSGKTITAAGTYRDTLTSSRGCDSIINLILTVNSVLRDTTRITICTNQLPYTWNGNIINTAGTFRDTLASSRGCDSIINLILTVNSILRDTTRTTICTNQLPYNWNGNTINTAGTYRDTLTSSRGCDSIINLILTVNSILRDTTRTTICTNQLPYNWNGNNITAAGTYRDTLTSSRGCDSISTLILTVNSILRDTTRTTICTNQLPYTWNSNIINAAGTYRDTLTSSRGCDSISTLILTVNSILRDTTRTTICTNQLPYNWSGNTINAAGTYRDTLTSSGGCDSIINLILTVNSILRDTTRTTICTNQLPYTWSGKAITAAGTYRDTLTSSRGCDSIINLILTVNSILRDTTRTTICTNQLPYMWNGNTINTAGTYRDTLSSSRGCDSISTLILTVNSILRDTTRTTICTNQLPYTWNGNIINTAGTFRDTLASSRGCDSIINLILTVNSILRDTTRTTICTNQLPYTWNGNTINAAGTYRDTLTSSGGCDSIINLILTVNSVLRDTTRTTICTNQLPYTWNGNTINAAGTYRDTLTSSRGCDSISTLILTVNSILRDTTRTTICTNQLPYTWNGNTVNAAGTYRDTLTSRGGCDSISTLILTVNSILRDTTRTTICTNQLPYNWNGNTINAAGTYRDTLTSSGGCDSIINLILTVNSVLRDTTRTTICTNQLPYNWNGNTINAAGTYRDTLTSRGGCDSISTLILTVNSILRDTTRTTICTNQLPYNWNGNNITAAGTYRDTITSSRGCDSISTLILNVNPALTTTQTITVCPTQLPYTWNGNTINTAGTYRDTLISSAGCDSIITLNLTIKPSTSITENISTCETTYKLPNGVIATASGTYRSTFANQAGCDSTIVTNLTLLSSPNLIVNNPSPGCSQTTIDLTAQAITAGSDAGLSFTYYTDPAATRPVSSPKAISTGGTYYIKATNAAGCHTIKPVSVQFSQPPTATITGGDVCPGAKAKLTITLSGKAPFAITYTNGTTSQTIVGITTSTYQLEVSPTTNTTYTITSVSDALCTNSTVNASTNVNIIQPPPSIRYGEVITSVNVATPLKARSLGNNYAYKWTPGTGLSKSDIMNPVFSYGQRMDYLIIITDEGGCTIVDTQTVKVIARTQVNEPPNLWVPTAWSPHNKDGHNDFLYPFHVNIVELRYFRVFNRWGELVFETKTLDHGWDGIYKGVPQVMDTYTWTVEAVGNDGTVFKKAGNAMLLR
jgi:gliding motility-associated-like protein